MADRLRLCDSGDDGYFGKDRRRADGLSFRCVLGESIQNILTMT